MAVLRGPISAERAAPWEHHGTNHPDGKVLFEATASRTLILDGALELLRSGGTVSLESAARRAGLTKPGVMYHFRTKEALMLALVDRVMDGWEEQMARRLPDPAQAAPAADRLRAYLDWCLSGEIDEADLVMLTDPRLREPLKARWAERMRPWVDLPDDLPSERRARLLAVRLIAEGAWFVDATSLFALGPDERVRVRVLAEELLGTAP